MDKLNRRLDSEIAELDKLKTGSELARVITRIVDVVMMASDEVAERLAYWERQPQSLDRMAALAELEVRRKELKRIRKGMLRAIKSSTNRLVLAAIRPGQN